MQCKRVNKPFRNLHTSYLRKRIRIYLKLTVVTAYKPVAAPYTVSLIIEQYKLAILFKEGIYDHFCPNMAADILEILERIIE